MDTRGRAAVNFKKRVQVFFILFAAAAAAKVHVDKRTPQGKALRVMPPRKIPMNWQSRLDSLNDFRFLVCISYSSD